MDDAISARVRAETVSSALRESEQRLLMARKGAMSASGNGTWSATVSSSRRNAPASMARSAEALGELAAWQACLHPDDRPHIEQLLAERAVSMAPVELEFRILLPDGGIRWLVSKGASIRTPSNGPCASLASIWTSPRASWPSSSCASCPWPSNRALPTASSPTPGRASSTSTPPSSPPAVTSSTR